jgi:four helix bundle protein
MKIKTHFGLEVYQLAFNAAMKIYELTKLYPKEEKYSLVDQIWRSLRSICSNLAEAFRKRRYEKPFISKLNDSEGESAETQSWLEFSLKCNYISEKDHKELNEIYDNIIGKLVTMQNHPENWTL